MSPRIVTSVCLLTTHSRTQEGVFIGHDANYDPSTIRGTLKLIEGPNSETAARGRECVRARTQVLNPSLVWDSNLGVTRQQPNAASGSP